MERRLTEDEFRKLIGDPQKIHDDMREFRKSEDLFCTSQYYKLLEEYPDKWIAVTAGKVEAHGDSYEEVLQMVCEKGLRRDLTIIELIETDPINMIL